MGEASNPGYRDARHLRAFLSEYADIAVGALLLHTGPDTFRMSEGVLATPRWSVL
jgi:hypothetical protein